MTTRRPLFLLLAGLALFAAAGCSDNGADPITGGDGGGGGGGGNETVSFAADVQPVFTANCVGCHGRFGNGGLDLRAGQAWGNLVDQASATYTQDRVVPGVPDQSLLYLKITGAAGVGGEMPPGNSLPAGEITTIRTWIEEGALDN